MSDAFFRGKTAVVTGAGGTLGSAIAVDLASRGAAVALVGRTAAKLEPVADAIRMAGGVALPLAADVTDPAAMEGVRRAVEADLGSCAILVNAAGGNQPEAVTTTTEFDTREGEPGRPEGLRGFFDLDPARFLDVIRTNTMGTVIPCRVFGLAMAQEGRGSILNFASMNSYHPLTRVPAYGIAKAGVVNFTEWLAAYLAPAGVRVNAVAPGFFLNDRSRKIILDADGGLTERGERIMAHTPMRRFGEAADLLGCVAWLLDDERAGFVTGITVPVDGGFQAASGV